MASYLKFLFVVALLVRMGVAEVSAVSDQEMKQAQDRFCVYTHEQKRTAVNCAINNYPAVARDIIMECTPPEETNGSWETLIDTISYHCNPEQYGTPRRRNFLECMEPEERKATNLITAEELDEARNAFLNCINEAGAERS